LPTGLGLKHTWSLYWSWSKVRSINSILTIHSLSPLCTGPGPRYGLLIASSLYTHSLLSVLVLVQGTVY
jgi:hypothetical protein